MKNSNWKERYIGNANMEGGLGEKLFLQLLLAAVLLSTIVQSSLAQEGQEKTYIDAEKWVNIAEYCPSIKRDIKYATEDNFVGEDMYDCPACYLRPEAAIALGKVQDSLQNMGYGLLVYDCYRPRFYQWKLWEKVPNPQYVADPRKGSVHNKGRAVDLTLTDSSGRALEMGTGYDYFGEEAHHDFKELPEDVLKNRRFLKEIMAAFGFQSIRTEWWHYNFTGKGERGLSDGVWPCSGD